MRSPNYMKSQLTRQLTTNLLLLKEFYYALLTSLKNEKRWLGLDLGAFAFPELCVQTSQRLLKALKALNVEQNVLHRHHGQWIFFKAQPQLEHSRRL